MRKLRANFEVVVDVPEGMVIRDRCVGMSITNDAEAVVEHLLAEKKIRPGKRLHYFDTENNLHELKFGAKGFIAFFGDEPDPAVLASLADVEPRKLRRRPIDCDGFTHVVQLPANTPEEIRRRSFPLPDGNGWALVGSAAMDLIAKWAEGALLVILVPWLMLALGGA